MKVVIARYGDFSPSKKLVDRLIELGMTFGEYQQAVITSKQKYDIQVIIGQPDSRIGRWRNDVYFFRDDVSETQNKLRTDPRLVQAVQEIGGKESAYQDSDENSNHEEELVIVEIPDGIEFYITEPDCSLGEIIVEKHRTWHYEERVSA